MIRPPRPGGTVVAPGRSSPVRRLPTGDADDILGKTTMTTDLDQAADLRHMGPVDFLVLEFPGNRMTGEAFPLLIDLVDRGIIRILDLAFLRKETDGTVTTLTQVDLERMEILEAVLFEGAASGLLGPEDLDQAAKALEPGSSAGVLIYENVWAAPFAEALRRAGGQLVASGRIPVQELVASLDALEEAAGDPTPAPRDPAQGS